MRSPTQSNLQSGAKSSFQEAGARHRLHLLEASLLGGPSSAVSHSNTDVGAIVTGALGVLLGVVFLAFPLVFSGGLSTHFSLAVMGCAFVAMGLNQPALARCLALPIGIANVAIFVGYIKYGPPGLDSVIIMTLWPEAPKVWGGNLNADLAYAVTAIAILLLTEAGWKFRWRSTAIVLTGSATLGLGVLGLSSYLTGLGTAYGLRRLIGAKADSMVGVLLLGAGLLVVSWRKGRHVSSERQAWILAVVAMSGVVLSTSLWQALMLVEELPIKSTQQFRSYVERIVLTFGAVATILLAVAVAFVQKLRNLNEELERRVQEKTGELLAKRQAEQALARANAYNRSLIEASIDPLVTIGADGRITDVNAATEAATGCSRQELIGTDFCDYFTEPEKARAGYQQAFCEGGVRDYALELRHRDGHLTPVLYNASVYHDQARNVIGVFAAARDITARKRTEQVLRFSEQRYRALLIATAQVVWATPPDGLVEDMPMWREYTGQSIEEVRGWGWLNAIHPDDRERTGAIWSKAVKTHGLYETEYRIRRADGQYRHFAIRGVPVLEDDGSIREWVGICTDIHERKQIEDELRKQAVLLNLAHDAILVSDLQSKISFWNRGAEETYGWSATEGVGRNASELLHTQFPVPLPEIQAMVQQQGEWEGELKHRTRDGRTIVVASRWSLQRDHHGAPASILEINRDITERKRLEEELRARQAYTRSLIEASLDPLVTIAADGRITDVNRATEEVTGVGRAELVGSDFSNYFTQPEKARAGYQQVFAEGLV
ncbi:MAG TPA: PAS domain S-box protein, partial [Terriglobia bacterium]|nr:PAS domain S-box protein [Terriglobia bacterium]